MLPIYGESNIHARHVFQSLYRSMKHSQELGQFYAQVRLLGKLIY